MKSSPSVEYKNLSWSRPSTWMSLLGHSAMHSPTLYWFSPSWIDIKRLLLQRKHWSGPGPQQPPRHSLWQHLIRRELERSCRLSGYSHLFGQSYWRSFLNTVADETLSLLCMPEIKCDKVWSAKWSKFLQKFQEKSTNTTKFEVTKFHPRLCFSVEPFTRKVSL